MKTALQILKTQLKIQHATGDLELLSILEQRRAELTVRLTPLERRHLQVAAAVILRVLS